jgi:hypothetical protein
MLIAPRGPNLKPAEYNLTKIVRSIGLAAATDSRDDALAHRIKNKLRNAVDIELLEDMAPMSLDCGRADIQ